MRSIKFSCCVGQQHVTWPELREAARVIEDLGFDLLWCIDHLIPSGPGLSQGPILEGWTLLGALAMVTKRIRIGCLVSCNTFRHPVVLAKSATTVDIISGGRLVFGIGAGQDEPEHRAYDIPFPTIKERIQRLDEVVELIKLLWESQGPVDYRGQFYSLKEAPFDPKPIQKPHPPILVAGAGEKRTLRVVAKRADAMNVFGSPDIADRKFRILEQHCKEVGRDPREIEKTVGGYFVPPEKMGQWEQYLGHLADTMPQEVEGQKSSAVVGDMDSITGWVKGQVDVGADQIIFDLRPPYPFDSLRAFARKVMPQFR